MLSVGSTLNINDLSFWTENFDGTGYFKIIGKDNEKYTIVWIGCEGDFT